LVADELRLGTRGSQLALWQANAVAARIAESGGPPCQIVVIKTTGDHLQDRPLSESGGKRLFVKEIEDALLRDEVDLAVHSSKDMPALLPDGLAIAGVLPRADPHDAVVLPEPADMPSTVDGLVAVLGQRPVIGTSSVRRIAQLTRLLPGARFAPIRGNLDTRLRKLDEGQYTAIVLAAAGLRRLGFSERISMTLPATACVPSPGQGIVAIEIRTDDRRLRDIVGRISDAAAAAALDAERAVVEELGGGCQTPIGALAIPQGDELEMVAAVVSLDGSRVVRAQLRGSMTTARLLGKMAGVRLLDEGAGDILADAERQRTASQVPSHDE
jgi:hydroxymethylbilane synthase